MNWDKQNTKVYDEGAAGLAEYFKGIGPRTDDIKRALELAKASTNARVVEIGCGDGRDAEDIVKRVAWYEGFDPSEGMLELARKKLPEARFVKADALSYAYPKDLDVIYSFASLLHVKKDNLKPIFEKVGQSLRQGGILFLSLKERDTYTEEPRTDQFGERMFYYYNPAIIESIAPAMFESVYEDHQATTKSAWFTLALQRK